MRFSHFSVLALGCFLLQGFTAFSQVDTTWSDNIDPVYDWETNLSQDAEIQEVPEPEEPSDDSLMMFSPEGFSSIEFIPSPPPPPECIGCLNDEIPDPGRYIISAWVSQYGVPGYTHFPAPYIEIRTEDEYEDVEVTTITTETSDHVIDEWQLLEGEFIIPENPISFSIALKCDAEYSCVFDDVRYLPYDASMKCYVYDPYTLRLMAELDERHYSTFYEYDEEGRLKRVKKETHRGIMTIQETNTSTVKQ